MGLHQINKIVILGGTLLSLLTSCSNSAAIESLVGPDPKLKENLANKAVAEAKTATSTTTFTTDNLSSSANTSANLSGTTPTTQPEINTKIKLPKNFPQDIPIYSPAKLRLIQPGWTIDAGKVKLTSPDDASQVASYYQTELETSGWKIIQAFTPDFNNSQHQGIAIKDNLKIAVEIAKTEDDTQLTIAYEPIKEENSSTLSSTGDLSDSYSIETEAEKNLDSISLDVRQNKGDIQDDMASETAIASPTNPMAASEVNFTDLDEVPEQLSKYVEEVAALGILTPYTKDGNTDFNKFAPNQPVTRGEYASWLIAANNKYYSDSPGNKIYAVNKSDRPAFEDINSKNPDFSAIQGLAEAGLIPSMLTSDSSKLLFQPDAPLKREDLILWKVPLDVRKALPKASIEAIQESWGFQDAANVEPEALKALFADYQNGELSNIKRIFGFTTLFQPKKPITRAEAAASLWHFGFQGDGITAPEVLKLKRN